MKKPTQKTAAIKCFKFFQKKPNIFKSWKIKIFLALALFLFFLPQILSLKPFQNIFFALIKKTSSFQIEAETVSFSWFSAQKFKNLEVKTAEFHLSADELVFKKPLFALLYLKKATFLSASPSLKIHKGRLRLFYANSQKTSLNQIEILFDANETNGDLVVENFPTFLVDKFFKSQELLQALLGKEFNAHITFQIEDKTGPIDIELASSNYQGRLFLNYTPLGITLREAVSCSFLLNSTQFLQDLNLFSISYFNSLTPLKISIPKEGFFLPLPFDLKNLVLEKVFLDLGKIKINSHNNLALIISVLKDHKLAASQEMELWCAPTIVNLKAGLLQIERLDILIDQTLPICTMGKIDLLNSKIDMSLGLTAAVLKHSFRIKKLPSDYVLAIPLSGSFKKIKINKRELASKIAALMSYHQKSIVKQFPERIQSIDEEKIFPPSIEQLPWEN